MVYENNFCNHTCFFSALCLVQKQTLSNNRANIIIQVVAIRFRQNRAPLPPYLIVNPCYFLSSTDFKLHCTQNRCSRSSFNVCSSRRGRVPGDISTSPSKTNTKNKNINSIIVQTKFT